MNLTVTHAGTPHPDGTIAFSWAIDAEDGTRLAEQAGTCHGYDPREATPALAHLEALLAALEWLQPLAWVRVAGLTVPCGAGVAEALARPDAGPDDHSPAARCRAYLALFRRRGAAVTAGGPAPARRQSHPPRKRKAVAPAHGRECDQ